MATLGNTKAISLTLLDGVIGDLNPKTTGTYNLGSSSLKWKNYYGGVADYNNNTPVYFGYSTSSMTATSSSWIAIWDASTSGQYRLRAISPANLRSAMGLGNTVGVLPVEQGGTGTNTLSSGQVLIGNGTSAITTRAILNNTSAGGLGWNSAGATNADNLRLVDVNTIAYWDGSYNGTNSNLTKLGTVTTGTWSASTIAVNKGGTGKTSWTQWGVLYADTTTSLTNTAAGTSGQLLKSNGSAAPGWISQSDITAGKATKLETARNIDGVSFDGSANITHYGVCSTAAGTAAKTVAITGFTLETGSQAIVKFSSENTANNPTLSINSTTAKAIYYRGARVQYQGLTTDTWYHLVYDGTYYQVVNTIKPRIGTCSTAAGTATKAVTCPGFVLHTGAVAQVTFSNTNSAITPTLNINSTGAKAIRLNTSDAGHQYKFRNDRTYCFVYDGTRYRLIDDVFQHDAVKGVTGVTEAWIYNGVEYSSEADAIAAGGTSSTITHRAAVAAVTGYEDLYLGNGTTSNQTNGMTGRIGLYGSAGYYQKIIPQPNGANRDVYLPNYAGSMYLVHAADNNAKGSGTKPIYVAANGRITEGSTYAGGTKVTLNGTAKGSADASFYAPTGAGTSGQYLKSSGSGAPTWANFPTSMTPASHTHGNIQNNGTLQTNDVTIASGDKLVITDSSDSSKVARASISFDGSTATKALTQKGTWETFNNYSLPLAADGTRGGVQIGYTSSGKNYAVQLSSEKMYVNVPWENTTYSAGTGLTLNDTTFNHTNSVTAKTAAAQSAKTLTWGGTFAIYEELYDAQGHITGVTNYNMTMPSNPNTDTKLRVYSSATNISVPLIGQSSANSTTAAWSTYTGTYKDWYGAIPNDDTKRAKINLSTGAMTVPGGITANITGNVSGSSGSCTGNAATATKFASAQSVTLTGDVTGTASSQAGWSIATTLANSGVTANSYGPSDDASPAHSGTFSVPYITVDAKGRITAASTKTITLPASGNTDEKVKQTAVTASGYTNWRTLIWGSSNSATEGFTPSTVTDQVYTTSVFSVQPSTGTIKATVFKGKLTGNADTATKLATAREIYVDLSTTRNTNSKVTFDGSADKAIHVSGTLTVGKGGTGLSSLTQYAIYYASTTSAFSAISPNTTSTKKFLRMTGTGSAGAAPAWDTLVAGDIPNLDASKITSGILPVSQGGTGVNSIASGELLIGNGTSAIGTRAITNNTTNTAITTGTTIPTMNTIYYGLVTVNGASQSRANGIYAPTSAGTNTYVLTSNGSGAPGWTAQTALTSIFQTLSSATNTLTVKIGGTEKTCNLVNSVAVSWTAGTTAGPTAVVKVNGVQGSAVIPSASTSASGIVTTGAQSFLGRKIFGYITRKAYSDNGTASQYPGDTYLVNNAGTQVGEYWYDIGNATNITKGQYYWREYSPQSTADTTTTGFYETYSLPNVTSGRTANASYSILTTKNTITIGQGGTGKTSWTQWGIVYADTTTSLAQVAAGANTTYANKYQFLKSNGAAAPSWGTALSLEGQTNIPILADETDIDALFTAGTWRLQDSTHANTLTGTKPIATMGSGGRLINLQGYTDTANAYNYQFWLGASWGTQYARMRNSTSSWYEWRMFVTAAPTVATGGEYLPVYINSTGKATAVTGNSVIVNLASNDGASIFATSPRPGVTGTLASGNGGTGQTSWTASRLVYTSSATQLASSAIVSDGNYIGSVTYVSINAAHQTSYRLYVDGEGYATKFWNAVWNDYAEHRKTVKDIQLGQVVYEDGTGEQHITTHRLMSGCNITSDTFGTSMGKRDDCQTPIAVAGRVLAYINEPKDTYKPGDAVCSGPNGTVSKMTRKEIRRYPDAIIGYVSEIPDYDVWYAGNEKHPIEIKVDNRIWIKVN